MKNKNDPYNGDRKKQTGEFAMRAIVYCGIALLILGLVSFLIR